MIKVTVGEQKPQNEKPFPKLMKCVEHSNTLIVLFKKERTGVVVRNNHAYSIGEYYSTWAMEDFTNFNDPITLQNA